VMHGVAMLAKGDLSSAGTRKGNAAAFQDVRIEDIQQEMISRTLDLEDAQDVISSIVKGHSDALGIDPEDFDVAKVINADVAAHLASLNASKELVYSSLSRRGLTALAKLSPTGSSLYAQQDPTIPRSPSAHHLQFDRSRSETDLVRSRSLVSDSVMRAPTKGSRKIKFTASTIMAVLRGRQMETIIADMRLSRQRRTSRAKLSDCDLSPSCQLALKDCYEAWAHLAARRSKEREQRVTSYMAKVAADRAKASSVVLPPRAAAWRTQEEYRQRRRQWMMRYSWLPLAMHATRKCFEVWRELAEAARARRVGPSTAMKILKTVSPVKAYSAGMYSPSKILSWTRSTSLHSVDTENSPHNTKLWDSVVKKVTMGDSEGSKAVVIGEHLGSEDREGKAASGRDLILNLSYMEGIYETRVAAAERLLAFYVLFHAAVRPVSRLWGLSFDMDRSESRLRVASTPAPVPFVESTDADEEPPPQHDSAVLMDPPMLERADSGFVI